MKNGKWRVVFHFAKMARGLPFFGKWRASSKKMTDMRPSSKKMTVSPKLWKMVFHFSKKMTDEPTK